MTMHLSNQNLNKIDFILLDKINKLLYNEGKNV